LQYGVAPEHCVSLVQALAHVVPAALQATGLLHWTVVGEGQAPDPLHPAASVTVPFAQLAWMHAVELPG
jgi:hypothetical protein